MKNKRRVGCLVASALLTVSATVLEAQEAKERRVIRVERNGDDDPEIRVFRPGVKVARRLVKPNETSMESTNQSWLGVNIDRVSPVVAAQLDLKPGTGLVVEHVVAESPADEFGIQRYDVLTSLNDQILVNPDQLRVLVAGSSPGESVSLDIIRGGKRREVEVTLAKRKVAQFVHDSHDRIEKILVEKGGDKNPLIQEWFDDTKSTDKGLDKLIWQGRVRDDVSPLHSRTIHLGNAITVLKDDSGTYRLKNEDGKRHLRFEDENGAVVFDGFFGGDEMKELPEGVFKKLNSLQLPEDVGIKRLMNIFESRHASDATDINMDVEVEVDVEGDDDL